MTIKKNLFKFKEKFSFLLFFFVFFSSLIFSVIGIQLVSAIVN